VLKIEDVVAGYPPNKIVLRGISLCVNEGEIVTVMGHNGAGKTTLLNVIFGLINPYSGKILYAGRELVSPRPSRVRSGISYCPQGQGIFPSLTVMENLTLAASYLGIQRAEFEDRLDTTFSLFPMIYEKKDQMARTLSGGQQRMVSLGMVLMQGPRLLLLDEPSLGIAPAVSEQISSAVSKMNGDYGVSILLVEQDISLALRLTCRICILKMGQIIFSGDQNILQSPEKLWEYL